MRLEDGMECSYKRDQFFSTQAGRWDDFLHLQLVGGIEFAGKHSMISSQLPDFGLRGGIYLLI